VSVSVGLGTVPRTELYRISVLYEAFRFMTAIAIDTVVLQTSDFDSTIVCPHLRENSKFVGR